MRLTYFIQAVHGGPIKIGKTVNAQARLRDLQVGSGYALGLIGYVEGDREGELHRQFSEARLHGEWFYPANELLAFIKEHAIQMTPAKPGGDLPLSSREDAAYRRKWLIHKWANDLHGEWVEYGHIDDLGRDFYTFLCDLEVVTEFCSPTDDTTDDPERGTDLCSCEGCCWMHAYQAIDGIEPIGAVWTEKFRQLSVFVLKPTFEIAESEILKQMAFACFEADSIGVQIDGYWVAREFMGYEEMKNLFALAMNPAMNP